VIGDNVDVLEAWERGSAMKIIATIIISYLIGGAYYVWSDLRQPLYHKPGYIRSGRSFAVVYVLVTWLPGGIWVLNSAGYRSIQGRQVIRSLAAFVIALLVGVVL
jgi:hypothetical protein